MEIEELQKKSCGDIAHGLVKGALGTIPVLGAPAAEIFGLIVSPPLEKRRIEWMNEIAEKLKELENSNRINIAELANDEHFIDVVLQSTTFALRTSQKEKKEAFKNAILNTAVKYPIDETKAQIFLNQLDKLTYWHIIILQFLKCPSDWLVEIKKTLSISTMMNFLSFIKEVFPELKNEDELIEIIWNDLKIAGFHNSTDLNTLMSAGAWFDAKSRTTEFGNDFLDYIRFV